MIALEALGLWWVVSMSAHRSVAWWSGVARLSSDLRRLLLLIGDHHLCSRCRRVVVARMSAAFRRRAGGGRTSAGAPPQQLAALGGQFGRPGEQVVLQGGVQVAGLAVAGARCLGEQLLLLDDDLARQVVLALDLVGELARHVRNGPRDEHLHQAHNVLWTEGEDELLYLHIYYVYLI